MPERHAYRELAHQLAAYLAARQQPDGGFPGPDHYGVASAVWLWAHFGQEFAPCLARALARLRDGPPRSHGEFNGYALLQAARLRPDLRLEPVLAAIRFGGRHSANWMLLRAACRALRGGSGAARGAAEARAALLRYAHHGFIADRPGVRSLAYHVFCGALLAEMWRHHGWSWAGSAALQAARVAQRLVLPNGDALYVGRGQQQVFGYGALLLLLEAAAGAGEEPALREAADRVFAYLGSYQRPDGSLPLVLSRDEPPEPWLWDARPGWYTYNRYADYLPFLACLLLRAAEGPAPPLPDAPPPPPPHPAFRRWDLAAYSAVVALPGGASTNDLAFPYVCVRGEPLLPCYGGEHPPPPDALPLPYAWPLRGSPFSFRDRVRYQWEGDGLAGACSLFAHRRGFTFGPTGFVCRDRIAFRRPCEFAEFVPANFLFRDLGSDAGGAFMTRCGQAAARVVMRPRGEVVTGAAVTASGRLDALRLVRRPFRAAAGERLAITLEVEFL